MSKLGEIEVKGALVSVFQPPHDEPDFPWVDVGALARAFLPEGDAKRMVRHLYDFGLDQRPYAMAKDGDRVVAIVPHAMAQGLCGAIDHWNGHLANDDDNGPAHWAYCAPYGRFVADNCDYSFDGLFAAFKNAGGKYTRDLK